MRTQASKATSWRNDIARIKFSLTGEKSTGWRRDIIDIAKSKGHNPKNWRDALIYFASDYNVNYSEWRKNLVGVSKKMGGNVFEWRGAIQFIADNFAPPPEIPPDELPTLPIGLFFLMAKDGIITNENNFIVVRG